MRGKVKNPLEGHYKTYFPLKDITTKVCPRSLIHTFYFYLEIIYSKKNPSDAIYRTTFFTFNISKYGHYDSVSGKKW